MRIKRNHFVQKNPNHFKINSAFRQNKMSEEVPTPLITRTIGMNPPIFFDRVQISPRDKRAHVAGPSRAFTSPGSSNSDDNVKKWRNRAIFPHIFPPPLAMHHPRPQMQHRQGNFNERLVTFRGPIVCIPNSICGYEMLKPF